VASQVCVHWVCRVERIFIRFATIALLKAMDYDKKTGWQVAEVQPPACLVYRNTVCSVCSFRVRHDKPATDGSTDRRHLHQFFLDVLARESSCTCSHSAADSPPDRYEDCFESLGHRRRNAVECFRDSSRSLCRSADHSGTVPCALMKLRFADCCFGPKLFALIR
jgi:hypothetical protein